MSTFHRAMFADRIACIRATPFREPRHCGGEDAFKDARLACDGEYVVAGQLLVQVSHSREKLGDEQAVTGR